MLSVVLILGLIIWAIYEVCQTHMSRKRGLIISIVSALLLIFLVSTVKYYAYNPCSSNLSWLSDGCENGPHWTVTWQMVTTYIGLLFTLGCGIYTLRKATK